jgi:hypothetical protein
MVTIVSVPAKPNKLNNDEHGHNLMTATHKI